MAQFSFFVLLSLNILAANSDKIFRPFEDISLTGKYFVKWEVDTETITFDVVVETLGYVGFGISLNGGMIGADVIIGGVHNNKSTYFSDRFADKQSTPTIDDSQDWNLISGSENGTHTLLSFSRLLDTCDKAQDLPITRDTLKLIWSFGETDTISFHFENKGAYEVNLLDPPMPPVDTSKFDVVTIEKSMTMPSVQTTYWCSIHKSPPYKETRYVVGFNTLLESKDTLAHAHHLDVYRCTSAGREEYFENLTLLEGGDCNVPLDELVVPVNYCTTLIYAWAIGGKSMFFPDHVGYPITVNGEPEYYLLTMHYNNPDSLSGVKVSTSVQMFNSKDKREYDAAVLVTGQSMAYSHLIPPKAPNFVSASHCGSACTAKTIHPDGIKFINVYLHSHLLGRKMKLRQFRGKVELPWIAVDNNYDFNYQQSRPMREELLVLPGDHLTLECTTDSSERSGITTAGLPTTAEMCQAIIWYYPSGELQYCDSGYPAKKIRERFGIESIKWDYMTDPPIVTAPVSMANKTFAEVVDGLVPDWTPKLIDEIQKELRFTEQVQDSCGTWYAPDKGTLPTKSLELVFVEYPKITEEYVPVDVCEMKSVAPELSYSTAVLFLQVIATTYTAMLKFI